MVRYVVLWLLVAALYALVFGTLAGLPPWAMAVDGAVFGVVSGMEGLILWNVLKYGTAGSPSANMFRIGRVSLTLAAGVLFIAVVVGAETAVLWLLSETGPETTLPPLWAFPQTIPARSMTVAAVYVCFVLWYSSAAPSDWGGNAHGGGNGHSGFGYAEFADSASSSAEGRRGSSPAKERLRAQPDGEAGSVPTLSPETLERITVRGTGGRIEVIGIERIVCIRAEGDYVAIVTSTGRWLKEGTMKWFEEALPRDRFVRVHRSCIVSVAHISRIETSGRDHILVMRDADKESGSPIRISDTGYRLLKRTLGL